MSDTAGLSPGTNRCAPSFTCCSVRIDAHTLESAVDALLSRSDQPEGWAVHLCNAYTLSLARRDPELRHHLNQGNLNLPDGMPLIWVGRQLGLDHLEGRVYGPDLMLAAMDRGRELGLRHYLHGSTDEVLKVLEAQLRRRLPGVDIVGRDAPPFRELTAEEELRSSYDSSDCDPTSCGLAWEHRNRTYSYMTFAAGPRRLSWPWARRLTSSPGRSARRRCGCRSGASSGRTAWPTSRGGWEGVTSSAMPASWPAWYGTARRSRCGDADG